MPEPNITSNYDLALELKPHGLLNLLLPRGAAGDGSSSPGGGVAIIYRAATTHVQYVGHDADGGLCVRVERDGSPAFTLIALYLPTSGSPRARSFNRVVAWMGEAVATARTTAAPFVAVAGDVNVCVGEGLPHWGRKALDARPPNARDKFFVDKVEAAGLLPTSGMRGTPAQLTSQTAAIEGQRKHHPEWAHDYGRTERDVILLPRGAKFTPLLPDGIPFNASGCVHRPVSVLFTVPGPPPPQEPPRPSPLSTAAAAELLGPQRLALISRAPSATRRCPRRQGSYSRRRDAVRVPQMDL